jgi:uncharacterized protein YecT (DUF1311 family)
VLWPRTAPDLKDAAVINSCLAGLAKTDSGPEKYEAACLLKVANPCMGKDPANASDGRQIECLDRERLVWDKIINDSYKSVMNAIEPDQAKKLREVQKAWIHSRDITCEFFYDYFQGSMAYPMIASCNNRERPPVAHFISGRSRLMFQSGNSVKRAVALRLRRLIIRCV